MAKLTKKAIIRKKRLDQKKRQCRKQAFIRNLIRKSFDDIRHVLNPPAIKKPFDIFDDCFEFILADERFKASESRSILFRKFN